MADNGIVTDYDDDGFPLLARATMTAAWNGIGLAAPAAPSGTGNTGSGSTLPGGNYQVIVTVVNAAGESIGSASTTIAVTATDNLVINSPAAGGGATGWYAYVTQAGGSAYTRQQTAGSPTNIGTGLTLTAPPTSTGASPPTVNTTGGILRTVPGRLARVSITTTLAGSGGNLSLYDSATGQPGTPLLVIPVASGGAGQVLVADMPAVSGMTALGLQLTAGAVTIGYS
jgi:hypothetical protein